MAVAERIMAMCQVHLSLFAVEIGYAFIAFMVKEEKSMVKANLLRPDKDLTLIILYLGFKGAIF